jgi:hypothetical protein
MGYHTYYNVELESDNETDKYQAKFELEKLLEKKYVVIDIDGFTYDHEPCKWYDYQNDVLSISKSNPNVTFIVEGVGEETLFDDVDIWRVIIKNGEVVKSYKADIIFKEYPITNPRHKTWDSFY